MCKRTQGNPVPTYRSRYYTELARRRARTDHGIMAGGWGLPDSSGAIFAADDAAALANASGVIHVTYKRMVTDGGLTGTRYVIRPEYAPRPRGWRLVSRFAPEAH